MDEARYTIKTGFQKLDRLMNGPAMPRLVGITGNPGEGKTALAWTVAKNCAINENRHVLFVTLRNGKQDFLSQVQHPSLYVEEIPDYSYLTLVQKVCNYRNSNKLDILIIDDFHLLQYPHFEEKRRLLDMYYNLQSMCYMMNISIIFTIPIHHNRPDRIPENSDEIDKLLLPKDISEILCYNRLEWISTNWTIHRNFLYEFRDEDRHTASIFIHDNDQLIEAKVELRFSPEKRTFYDNPDAEKYFPFYTCSAPFSHNLFLPKPHENDNEYLNIVDQMDDETREHGVIKKGEFKGQYTYRRIFIPSSVHTIDEFAFCGCENLRCVIIKNPNIRIRYGAFKNCPNLKTVTFNKASAKVEHGAFDKEF